ncbi:hypothetical protein E2C01_037309 [Portunus trituberculatus]|uniref:Uncharacterized protein n=1 Tax=Portunus trituberculatus TaxID=210409 RepID=A0A5B7FFA5_PORTR|nr:hypothetical protein [Portunus trituberculatus]
MRYIKGYSVPRHISISSFGCDLTILLKLGRVYGGQKINGHVLHYFNPHISF